MTRDPLKGEEIFKRRFGQTQMMLNPHWAEEHITPELRHPYVSYPLQAALFHFLKLIQTEIVVDTSTRLKAENIK